MQVLLASSAELFRRTPYRSPFHNHVARAMLAACACVLAGGSIDSKHFRDTVVISGIVFISIAIVFGRKLLLAIARLRHLLRVAGTAVDIYVFIQHERDVALSDFFAVAQTLNESERRSAGNADDCRRATFDDDTIALHTIDSRRGTERHVTLERDAV